MFAPNGTVLSLLATGAEDLLFNYPRGMAVDTSGDVFVADSYNNRIVILHPPAVSSSSSSSTAGQSGNSPYSTSRASHTISFSMLWSSLLLIFVLAYAQ